MAKQTFTTGQVLTAAQMTSLQQTAMGGGSATAKTASYVLVAADAGGTVAMNAAGATTITVNTALFAAGDTVFIQNLGAGACTVTAGTATVASAGSLILPQYDAGILYFTATGASIFYDYIQAGGASPLTTKGDLYTFSTSDARLAVGTNTHVLTCDSAEATGLKWAAAGGGSSALTKITAGSFSNVASVTVDSVFNSTYTKYIVYFSGKGVTGGSAMHMLMRYGSTTQTGAYYGGGRRQDRNNSGTNFGYSGTGYAVINQYLETGDSSRGLINFDQVGNQGEVAQFWGNGFTSDTQSFSAFAGIASGVETYTGFLFQASTGNISGTYAVYGLAN